MLRQRKAGTAAILAGIVFAMVGASFAAVPLYRIFCSETGYAGTTQRAETAPGAVAKDALVTVRFDASTAPDLGWDFAPEQASVAVHPGEQTLIKYHAVNNTKAPITGTATFNVTPFKAGIYFNKIQCFCFTKQHLAPGESADLAVSFFVDPDMLTDPGTRDVNTITLSYTMFRAKDDGQPDTSAAPKQSSGAQRPDTLRQNTASNAGTSPNPLR
jgi:cytochrome c oxidase assembly protein subunit 11